MTDSAYASPPRCSLMNLTTGEEMGALLNPTQLVEKISVSWNKVTVPGLSHQLLQFQGTGNRQLSGVEFYLDSFFAGSQPGAQDIGQFRAFLRALTVPPAGTKGVLNTAPPRVLVIWPGILTMESVVNSVQFTYKQFSTKTGQALIYTAAVDFEEILDVRVTSEQLREDV